MVIHVLAVASPPSLAVDSRREGGLLYPVLVKPKPGFFAFGIPPVPPETVTIVSESSKVKLRVDGKLVGNLMLGDDSPELMMKLAPGRHRFEFIADIYAHDSVTFSGRCTGTLQVKDRALTLRPWIDFSLEPGNPAKGHPSECELVEW